MDMAVDIALDLVFDAIDFVLDHQCPFAIFSALFAAIFVYHYRAFSHWSDRHVNGPRPLPIVGNLLSLINKLPFKDDFDNYHAYGKIFGKYEGTRPTLTIGQPDALKVIMVKDFHKFPDRRTMDENHRIFGNFLLALKGDKWRRVRSIMTATFSSAKMRLMFELMDKVSDTLIEEIKSKNGQEIEMRQMFSCYTMDVIAKCCFDTDINSFEDPTNEFIKNSKLVLTRPTWKIFSYLLLPPFLTKHFKISFLPESVTKFFTNVTTHLINKRRSSHRTKPLTKDFMQIMLDTVKDTNTSAEDTAKADVFEAHHVNETNEDKANNEKLFKRETFAKQPLTDDEIVANSVLFFAAGYETTATLLTFATHLLALNPNVQQTLYDELKITFSNGKIDYETLSNLKYLDCVISETLRICPPAIRIERVAVEDYVLQPYNIHVQKGTVIQIPVWAIHHDSDNYPEPETFDPTRFFPENRDKLVEFSYLPFGAGPRNCIGMRFALLEAKLALAKVVFNVQLQRSPRTKPMEDFDYVKSRSLLAIKSSYVAAIPRE